MTRRFVIEAVMVAIYGELLAPSGPVEYIVPYNTIMELYEFSGSSETLSIMIDYNDVVELDGEMALIAIDHAGNESEPSAPIHVSFGGCTFYKEDRACLEDASNCSVRRVAAGAAGAWSGTWFGLALATSVAWRRWSRRPGVRI